MSKKLGDVYNHTLNDIWTKETDQQAAELEREHKSSWPWVQWAAWRWLWHRKNRRAAGFWFISVKYRRFRKAWEIAFGECPFSWKWGPV